MKHRQMPEVHPITPGYRPHQRYVLALCHVWRVSSSPTPTKELTMSYVIALPCIGVKDTACVAICPCDCIHPTKDEPDFATAEQLYIDPAVCIDCDLCRE